MSWILTACIAIAPSPQVAAQDPALGSAATRGLDATRTLAAIELASREALFERSSDLPLLALWRHPKTAAFMRYVTSTSRDTQLFQYRDDWWKLLDRFDQGTAAALYFARGRWSSPRPILCMAGAASDADQLRGIDTAIEKILTIARTQDKIAPLRKSRFMVPDSPLAVAVLESRDDQQASDWFVRKAGYVLRKSRRAAFHGQYQHLNDESYIEKSDSGVAEALASIVGRRKGDDVMTLGGTKAYEDGESVLARGVVRFRENATHPDHGMRGNELEAFRGMGLLDWDGLSAAIVSGRDGLREVVDSHETRLDDASPFAFLRGDGRGLGDVAAWLPSSALAAMRVTYDDALATRWIQSAVDQIGSGRDAHEFFTVLRSALDLAPADPDEGVKGIPEITVALLPPAPGVLAPEFCVLLRVQETEAQAKTFITNLANLAIPLAGRALPVKTLGKGDEAIPYVAMKDLAGPGAGRMGAAESVVVKALLGGGFVSATRVGPFLAVGFNPRTVRKLLRSVTKGDTLAKREGFLARFPKASGRFFEAWFDWKSIVRSARVIDELLPLFIGMRASLVRDVEGEPDAEVKAPPSLVFPNTSDIAELVGEQWIRGSQTKFGRRFIFEGSLVLSPISISAWAMIQELCGQVARLATK